MIKPLAQMQDEGDRRGLTCRHCGGRKFRVIYVRRTLGNALMRRRACWNCGARITTKEREIGWPGT
jgi:hypothetical protein